MNRFNPFGGRASMLLMCGVATLSPYVLHAKKSAKVERKRPNVIIINADDLAWGDPSCYGGKLIETPNIDRLAKSGIQCTNGYVSAPVSGVSRVGLLTGSYQQRYGMQWNHDQYKVKGIDDKKPMLPPEQKQLQTAFKEAGYATAMAGKIGFRDAQPFGDYYSLSFNGVNSFPDANGKYACVDVVPGEKQVLNKNVMWGPERKGDEHITDRTGRQCMEFIEAHKDEPFFFYLAFTAPHTPLHAKSSFKPDVAHIKSEIAQLYYAMVLGVDENVGRIMDCLEKNNLREDTIVIFLSDNGPANPFHLSVQTWWIDGCPRHVLGQRGGLNGFKGNMWEAGIRVPYIVSWPGTLDQGVVYEESVSTLDVYPTLCAAADVAISDTTKLDGKNLMPYFIGDYTTAPHEYLFWYANRMGAARMGKWKMLIEDDHHYLFDLEADMGEAKSVMSENPEIMHKMLSAYFDFKNQMPAYRNPFARPIDIPSPEVVGIPVLDPQ